MYDETFGVSEPRGSRAPYAKASVPSLTIEPMESYATLALVPLLTNDLISGRPVEPEAPGW